MVATFCQNFPFHLHFLTIFITFRIKEKKTSSAMYNPFILNKMVIARWKFLFTLIASKKKKLGILIIHTHSRSIIHYPVLTEWKKNSKIHTNMTHWPFLKMMASRQANDEHCMMMITIKNICNRIIIIIIASLLRNILKLKSNDILIMLVIIGGSRILTLMIGWINLI